MPGKCDLKKITFKIQLHLHSSFSKKNGDVLSDQKSRARGGKSDANEFTTEKWAVELLAPSPSYAETNNPGWH